MQHNFCKHKSIIHFVLAFAVITVFLFHGASFASAISASGPIIPCGSSSSGQPPCNICHIPYLIKNLADYMFEWVGIPFAILIFAIAGIRMIVGSSKESEITAARTMITNTLLGLGIMLVAWVIVNTAMILLTGGQTSFNNALFSGPWNQLPSTENCPLSGPVGTGGGGGEEIIGGGSGGETPGGGGTSSTNPLVDNVINNANIAIAPDSTGDCFDVSGNRVGPQTVMNQADHNQPLTVCSAGCTGQSVCAALSAGPTLNQNMLNATAAAANAGYSFTITSLTTGSHASNSQHYMGNAEDLVPRTISSSAFDNLQKFFIANKQLYNVDQAFCENASGIASCTSSGITHVHVQFRR